MNENNFTGINITNNKNESYTPYQVDTSYTYENSKFTKEFTGSLNDFLGVSLIIAIVLSLFVKSFIQIASYFKKKERAFERDILYEFQHKYLVHNFFNTSNLVQDLLENKTTIATAIWTHYLNYCNSREKEIKYICPKYYELFKIDIIECEDRNIIILEMNFVQEATDCKYIGMIEPKEGVDLRPRYFTLEYGINEEDNEIVTFLCEWKNDEHLNYGIVNLGIKSFINILSEINDNTNINKLIRSMGYTNNVDYKKFEE